MPTERKIEFGRYQIENYGNMNMLFFENIYKKNDFWLTIKHIDKGILGHLKFKKSDSINMFLLDDMRPAHCPIQDLSILCKESSR